MSFISPEARQAPAGPSVLDGIFSCGGGIALLTLSVLLILAASLLREWYHPSADRHPPMQKNPLRNRCARSPLDQA